MSLSKVYNGDFGLGVENIMCQSNVYRFLVSHLQPKLPINYLPSYETSLPDPLYPNNWKSIRLEWW